MGQEFVYHGETDEGCGPCKLRKVCHTGEVGRRYRVDAVRPVKHDVCHVFDGKVQIVEVSPLPLRVNVAAASLRGTIVTRRFDECGFRLCPNRGACDPLAVPEGARVSVKKVGEAVDCPAGRDLRSVTVAKA